MKIDADAIRELAGLLDETGLNEIEVVDGEKSIRVNKGQNIVATAGAPVVMAGGDPGARHMASMDAPSDVAASHPGAVTSPMVGTVYLQSEPGAPPYVKKGMTVSEGDTLVIIEAMKVMNPIKAAKSGTVVQVCIENGQPVEFGDVLVVIE